MMGFFKGVFGLGTADGTFAPAELRAADLRDSIVDQFVTMVWALLLIAQEWSRHRQGLDALPVAAMGLVAAGYAGWRLVRLVPLWKAAA